MDKPRVRIYLDDHPQPIIDQELPTEVSLDTGSLEDGPHRLTIRAQDQNGREGVEEIPFQVHNGPGIVVSGLQPNSTRRGRVHFTVDAFSTDDPFDPVHPSCVREPGGLRGLQTRAQRLLAKVELSTVRRQIQCQTTPPECRIRFFAEHRWPRCLA